MHFLKYTFKIFYFFFHSLIFFWKLSTLTSFIPNKSINSFLTKKKRGGKEPVRFVKLKLQDKFKEMGLFCEVCIQESNLGQ